MSASDFFALCVIALVVVAVLIFIKLGGFCWLFSVLHATSAYCDAVKAVL